MKKELEDIDTNETDAYMLEAAPFIYQMEKERRHEQEAYKEMGAMKCNVDALSIFLDILPKTDDDIRLENLKKRSLANVGMTDDDFFLVTNDVKTTFLGTSGRAPPKKKHKSRKKVAQPGGVTPGNVNSKIPAPKDGQTTRETDDKREKDILSIFQTAVTFSGANINPVTKEKPIFADYLAKVEKDPTKQIQLREQSAHLFIKVCPNTFCGGEMTESHVNDCKMVCSKCGYCDFLQPELETGVFDEQNQTQQSSYAYQKKNHFRDWLAKAQGLENRTIPEIVYDTLRNELKRMQIKDAESVTRHVLHKLLKKRKMSTYYHNLSKIHYHLTGKRPPVFTQDEIEIMTEMFAKLEPVFEELKPKNRTNFFSYEYVINKFCQIQAEETKNKEWLRYFNYFKMMKCPDKRHQADMIWRQCCTRLGWKYIRS